MPPSEPSLNDRSPLKASLHSISLLKCPICREIGRVPCARFNFGGFPVYQDLYPATDFLNNCSSARLPDNSLMLLTLLVCLV